MKASLRPSRKKEKFLGRDGVLGEGGTVGAGEGEEEGAADGGACFCRVAQKVFKIG